MVPIGKYSEHTRYTIPTKRVVTSNKLTTSDTLILNQFNDFSSTAKFLFWPFQEPEDLRSTNTSPQKPPPLSIENGIEPHQTCLSECHPDGMSTVW